MTDGVSSGHRPAVVAALGLPVVVGVLALVQGYPVPGTVAGAVSVVTAGVALAALGLVAWWWSDRDRPAAAACAALAVVAALAWSFLAPGVSAARVDDGTLLAGTPVLARFAGAAPWVVVAVSVVGLLEPVLPGRGDDDAGLAGLSGTETRKRALGRSLRAGVAFSVLAVAPSVLLGEPLVAPALLGFALVGGSVAATVVAYLYVRHRLVVPLLVLGVVATAAVVTVTAGGSPHGFPTAWPVWFLPGAVLGGVEAAGHWLRGRLGSS